MHESLRASKRRKLSHDDSAMPMNLSNGNKEGDPDDAGNILEVRPAQKSKRAQKHETQNDNEKDIEADVDDELQIMASESVILPHRKVQEQPSSSEVLDATGSVLQSDSSDDDDDGDGSEKKIVIRSSGRQRKAPRRFSNEMVIRINSSRTPRSQTPRDRSLVGYGSKQVESPSFRKGQNVGSKVTEKGKSSLKRARTVLRQISPTPMSKSSALVNGSRSPQASPKINGLNHSSTLDQWNHTKTTSSFIRECRFSITRSQHDRSEDQQQRHTAKPAIRKSSPLPKVTSFKPKLSGTTSGFDALKWIVLSKITGKRLMPLTALEDEYVKVHDLLKQTIVAGEGNSMLLIGARGTGKTALVNTVLHELFRDYGSDFHIVKLNGFLQTDNKLALREIWRQLGRQIDTEDEVSTKNYADTLATLLALLSHPTEQGDGDVGSDQVARSVVFVMDEFDLFAAHPRQTLLYNLFEIAQSRKAPIAVLGLTTRVDVMESLEKRVKSRFSHRYVHVGLAKNVASFTEMCKKGLQIDLTELDFDERAILIGEPSPGSGQEHGNLLEFWNSSIETLLTQPVVKHHIASVYHTTKSLPAMLNIFHIPIANLTTSDPEITVSAIPRPSSLLPLDSKLALLPTLPSLALALLVAAARLDIILDNDSCNFNMVYDEYTNLGAKARVSTAASSGVSAGIVGVGGRVAGRPVARAAWEKLMDLDLLIPAYGSGIGSGAGYGAGLSVVGPSDMVKCDVRLEDIEAAVPGLERGLVKWCREI